MTGVSTKLLNDPADKSKQVLVVVVLSVVLSVVFFVKY